MKIRFKALIGPLALLVFTALATGACKNNGDDPTGQTAWVKMEVQTKSEISFPSANGQGIDLTQLVIPTADECTIEFTAADLDPVKKLYSEIARGTELTVGNYKVKASYGENPPAAWNNVYMEGNGQLTLSNSQNEAELKLECGIKSAFAFAKFDDKFRAVFQNFSVAFSTQFNASTPLIFKDGETKIASFKEAEKLWVVVTATKKSNGKTYTYGINPVMGLKGGDLHVFNFTVQDGDAAFTVNVDNGVNLVAKTVKLDPNWVDDRYTKMYLSYDQNLPVLFVAGMKSNKTYDVVVTSNLGLRNLFLDFDETFAAELGVSSVDLLNLTAEQKTLVDEKVGAKLVYNPDNTGYRLSLGGCNDKLKPRGGVTNYVLGVRYVDLMDNSESCKFNINMIEIKTDPFNGKRVWNRFAYIPVPYIAGMETSTLVDLNYEYFIKEGNGAWAPLAANNPQKELYLSGLKPNTAYQTRIEFQGFTVAETGFTTMPESFIENGDFEDNSTFTYGGRADRVGAEFTNWISTNATTTMNRSSDQYYRSYPSVRLTTGRSGKGVLIQTVGYGSGSVYQHKTTVWVSSWGTRDCELACAGKLSLESENGVSFNLLPNKMIFYYSYSVRRGTSMIGCVELLSNGEVIGSGQLVSNVNDAFQNKQQVVIRYKNSAVNSTTGIVKKPTHIKIWFSSKSSIATTSDLDMNDGSVRASGFSNTVDVWDARFEGSTLVIDDVQLTYPSNINEYTFE